MAGDAPPSRPAATSRPLAAWRRLTSPHPSVVDRIDQRRARLAANLLLVLILAATAYFVVYDLRDLAAGVYRDGLLSTGVLVSMIVAYGLVRTRHFRWGILVAVTAVALAIWLSLARDPATQTDLFYYTIVPILLGGLLLDLPAAAALAAVNLAAVLALPTLVPGAAPAGGEVLDISLFLLAASAIVLVGAGFMERSARETDEANARLREAERFRLRFLNTVAHDMGSPLTPIVVQLRLLEAQGGDGKRIAVMRRNVDVLRRLVDDVKDLARMEGGQLRLDMRPVDLPTIARSAADGFRTVALDKGVQLEVQAPTDGLEVEADPERLTQVFYNLLTNAVKFTPGGGRIQVGMADGDGMAHVRVQDTGRGLSADEIPRLFRPFSQVHDRSEVEEKGTGLGLFITKSLVEAHGGRIWVESDGHGKGSTFAFTLARRVDRAQTTEGPAVTAESGDSAGRPRGSA